MLTTDPTSGLHRLCRPDGRPLRAFLHDSIPYYLLPDPAGVFLAETLLAHLYAHEFTIPAPPLPPAVPADRPVCRRLGAYRANAAEGALMAAYCSGDAPADLDAEVINTCAQAGVPLMPRRAEHELILQHYCAPALTPEPPLPLPPLPPPAPLTSPLPPLPPLPLPPLTSPVPLADYGKITAAPAELVEAMLARRNRTPRRSWPFKKMAVGDMVQLPPEDAARGQRAAHAHAVASHRVYRTYRDRPSGVLRVYRIR